MCDNTYNGWTNYETWLAGLWLDNDYNTYQMIREWAREETSEGSGAVLRLAARLEEYVGEGLDELKAGLLLDLLIGATQKINFLELAEHILAE